MTRTLAAVSIALAIAAPGPRAAARPRIAVPSPEHHFGTRDNTLAVEHVFEIRNEGDAPLAIGRLRACCGGTAEISATEINPGSNAWLSVTLSLRGRRGRQSKAYYIPSNDPDNPYTQVRLVGTALAAVTLQPRWLDFPDAAGDETRTATVAIAAARAWRFRILDSRCDSPFFAWNIEEKEEGRHEIAVRTVPPLPPGSTRATLVLATDRPDLPELRIPLSATVPGDLFIVPSEILLSETETPVTRHLAVRSRKNKPFRILETAATDPGIEFSLAALPNGYRIEARNLVAHRDMEQQQILLTTDREDIRRIAVPLRIVEPPDERKTNP